ncbi:TlpA family protein disulfide reductase [Chloroflexota bacterium]
MKRILALSVIMLASLLLITGCPSTTATAPQVGKEAPDFQLPNPEGQAVSLGDFRGQPVMLNFWATWCGPCAHEMPFIQEVYDGWTGKSPSLVVLAVDMGEAPSAVRDFIESNNYTFPVLLDTTQQAAAEYGIRYIPTTFFIDENGIIQAIKVGGFSGVAEIVTNLSKITP